MASKQLLIEVIRQLDICSSSVLPQLLSCALTAITDLVALFQQLHMTSNASSNNDSINRTNNDNGFDLSETVTELLSAAWIACNGSTVHIDLVAINAFVETAFSPSVMTVLDHETIQVCTFKLIFYYTILYYNL
jgi:hypothetical protein